MANLNDVIKILDNSLPPLDNTRKDYIEWIDNSPFLYDFLQLKTLDRVSNTVQWVKGSTPEKKKEFTNQHIIVTTNLTEGKQNSVIDYLIQCTNSNYEADLKHYKEAGNLKGVGLGSDGKITPTKWVNHDQPIVKSRCMPQDNSIVAIGDVSGKISIYCLLNHPTTPEDIFCHPDYTLLTHSNSCRALDWCNLRQGYLASGGGEGSVCIWDPQGLSDSVSSVPIHCFKEQKGGVNTVSWHPLDSNVLGAGGEDCNVFFYDIRQAHSTTMIQAHNQSVQVVAFNPVERFLFATASKDQTIALWDQRYLSRPIHSLVGHRGSVTSLQWSPFSTCILASGSDDCRVNIWDLSLVGTEVPSYIADEGPPELVFVHGGHIAKINDICWSPNEAWSIVSVGDDSQLQVWHIATSIIDKTCCRS